MSRPEDPLGAISDLAFETQDPFGEAQDLPGETQDLPGQTDEQICLEDIEQRQADDAEAVRNAQARIDDAIRDIGSFRDQEPLPELPRAANLRLPDVADSPPTASEPPAVDDFAGFEARPPSGHGLQVMPPLPEDLRRPITGRLLNRYVPMVGFAAIVAYGITMFVPFQSDRSKTDNESGAQVGRMSNGPAGDVRPLLRLVIKNEQAFANEPILLGAAVAPPTDSGSLSLRGLAQGTRLSAGTALREDSWEFPLRYLGGVYVYAPPDFVGVMNAVIALLSPSKQVIDSHPMRLEWMAKADAPQLPSKQEIDSGTANAVPKMPTESGPASFVAKPQIDSGAVGAAAVRPMDPREAAALMERGRDLLRNGDVALAQLAFRRLAETGNADAAFALAATYDPRYLAGQKLIGIVGDEAKARAWYQRASELGSIEADRVLQRANVK